MPYREMFSMRHQDGPDAEVTDELAPGHFLSPQTSPVTGSKAPES
jgi:hypothetical protein